MEVLNSHPKYFECRYRDILQAEPMSLKKHKNWWKQASGNSLEGDDEEMDCEDDGQTDDDDYQTENGVHGEDYYGYFGNS